MAIGVKKRVWASSLAIVTMLGAASGLSAQMPGAPDSSGPDAMGQDGMNGGMMEMMGHEGMMGMMGMMGQGSMGGDMMQMMGQGMIDSGMMEMMEQGMGMMATGGPGPESILRMGDTLGLTDEQRTQLEAVRSTYQESAQPMMAGIMASLRDAEAMLEPESPDIAGYEGALQETVDQLVSAHVAMAQAGAEARRILTEAQLQQLESGMSMMEGMMGRGGGMMDQGMSH